MRKNTHFDQRRLTFFELPYTEPELKHLREDLCSRLAHTYSYDFFRHNCGHYIAEWLLANNNASSSILYFTPREALATITCQRPPLRCFTIPSDLETLEQALSHADERTVYQVRRGLNTPSVLREINDPVLQLLAIRVAESRSTFAEYSALESLQADILSSPGGPEAAQQSLQQEQTCRRRTCPTGFKVAVAGAGGHSGGHAADTGLRLSAEAGLRDFGTPPRATRTLRDIRFLAADVEMYSHQVHSDLVLASVSVVRDLRRIGGGLSSGFSLGRSDLPDPLAISGLYASTWLGASSRFEFGWLGIRAVAILDDLGRTPDLGVALGLTFDTLCDTGAFNGEEVTDVPGHGLGLLLRQRQSCTRTSSLVADATCDPDGA